MFRAKVRDQLYLQQQQQKKAKLIQIISYLVLQIYKIISRVINNSQPLILL